MKNKNCMYHILIGLFILVLLIPFTLNVVLQCEFYAGKIIGGSDSPHVWLVFWGAYLSAIGTGVMAYVAYRQGSDERKRNAMRIEYEAKQKEYDLFEEQLVRFANTYNSLTFRQIYVNIISGKCCEAIDLCAKLCNELNATSLFVPRYDNHRVSPKMKLYYASLRKYNLEFIDLGNKLKTEMKGLPSSDICQNRKMQQDRFNEKISEILCDVEKTVKKLSDNDGKDLGSLGFDALLEMQKDLDEMADKMK